MVLAYPEPPNKTTEMVARDAFLEALDDPEQVVHIQAQIPSSLDSAVRVAQHMEAVLHSVGSKHSRLVRAVVRESERSEADEGAKEALANQGAMFKALQDLTQKVAAMNGHLPASESKPYDKRGPRFGTTRITCFGCSQEGHFKRNCPSANVERSDPVPTSKPVRENRSVTAVGPNARRLYLEVLIDGEPVDCLLDTGSEVTLIPSRLVTELPKRAIRLLIWAAHWTDIEVLGDVELPVRIGN